MRSLLVASICLIGACASKPPAAEVCSADWIKPRTDAALNQFRSATKDSWQDLESRGSAGTGSGNLLERAQVIVTLTRLLGAFQDSQALEDLRTLSERCDDPGLVKTALQDTLRAYDVPQGYIDLLESLEAFTAFARGLETKAGG